MGNILYGWRDAVIDARPGDRVCVAGHAVWGNDKPLTQAERDTLTGQAFVLGDNRSSSTDARHFGPVPLFDIVGKARQIWYSSDAEDGVRWSRFGLVLE